MFIFSLRNRLGYYSVDLNHELNMLNGFLLEVLCGWLDIMSNIFCQKLAQLAQTELMIGVDPLKRPHCST